MATWHEIGEDSLGAAKTLKDADRLRSCISRAYFAAYACATGALLAADPGIGSPERPNPSHAQLAKLVRHNLDRRIFSEITRRDISRRIRNLRRLRESAEYMPGTYIDRHLAVGCLRDAGAIVEQLKGGG